MKQILEQLAKAGVRVMKADHQRLEGLSGGIPHQGLVALAKPIESAMSFDDLMDAINPKTLLLILDGVTGSEKSRCVFKSCGRNWCSGCRCA